jgi:hypothetical protein
MTACNLNVDNSRAVLQHVDPVVDSEWYKMKNKAGHAAIDMARGDFASQIIACKNIKEQEELASRQKKEYYELIFSKKRTTKPKPSVAKAIKRAKSDTKHADHKISPHYIGVPQCQADSSSF